jgi:hypothetical protein
MDTETGELTTCSGQRWGQCGIVGAGRQPVVGEQRRGSEALGSRGFWPGS